MSLVPSSMLPGSWGSFSWFLLAHTIPYVKIKGPQNDAFQLKALSEHTGAILDLLPATFFLSHLQITFPRTVVHARGFSNKHSKETENKTLGLHFLGFCVRTKKRKYNL